MAATSQDMMLGNVGTNSVAEVSSLTLASQESQATGTSALETHYETHDLRSTPCPESRQWKARLALRRAMHERRLADFNAALAEAQEVGLYAVELDCAKSVMKEQAKEEARNAMKIARDSRDVESLRRSIHGARSVQLPSDQIEITKKVLDEEIEKRAARNAILDAMRDGTLESLSAAVARGDAAGLDGEKNMDRARNALKAQQRKAAARENIARSLQTEDASEIKAALAEAAMAGLRPTEMEEAKQVYEILRRREEARRGLQSAEILRQAGDVEAFRAAVKEGEAAGLLADELKDPLQLLAMEDLKISARKNLASARSGRKGGKISRERMLEITQAAVEEGEAAGLTDAEMEEARSLLIDATKKSAQEALEKAVRSRSPTELHAAIEHGEAMGLTQIAFFDARRVIDELQRHDEARGRVQDALSSRRIFELKGAIRYGQSVKLDEWELDDAKVALAEEERKESARCSLQQAIDSRSIADLEAAISEGDDVGLTDDDIRPAHRALLTQRHIFARKVLADAVKRKSIEHLKVAIADARGVILDEADPTFEQAKSLLAKEEQKRDCTAALKEAMAKLNMVEMRKAIRASEMVLPGSKVLNDCKKTLKEEERRKEAYENLSAAIVSREIDKLRRWIGNAEAAGLHITQDGRADIIPRAQKCLAEEERKVEARRLLLMAERCHDIAKLRSAMQEAEDAGLGVQEFENAKAVLAEELPRAARAQLEKALSSRSIKDLKSAIKEGVSVGLEAEELSLPRLALGQEQLSEALRRKIAFEIRRAIEEGEVVGIEAMTLANARAVLAVVEKKEAARLQLRSAEETRRIDEIMAAMSAGRAAGLQTWEMSFAEKVVEEERRRPSFTRSVKSQ
mmetsp:Transcript_28076/g.45179  ORF Transcript_28076/g.45179 Transcript_28076/m.45179 type:complete len:862 (+) Transcript_28076:103-2688(+)